MSKPAPITQMIRRIVDDQRVKALPDRELVRLFRAEKDQAAHEDLVFGQHDVQNFHGVTPIYVPWLLNRNEECLSSNDEGMTKPE